MSVDDCIVFLADLARGDYKSMFDNEFLGYIKSVHERFGASFCLNLFYDNSTSAGFTPATRPFSLSDMTDAYKSEFADNSDWLKFSFHSAREYPAYPYEGSGYDEVFADARKVNSEIVRFAGEKALSKEMTLHFGLCTPDGFRALKDNGYEVFYGYLTTDGDKCSGSYYFDNEFLTTHSGRVFTENGATFRKTDILLNAFSRPADALDELKKVTQEREDFYELMFHEQYFYEDYENYIPNYRRIIDEAAKYMHQTGYMGGFTV